MIKSKMVRQGTMATAWWYMTNEARRGFDEACPALQCPAIYDGMPEAWLSD
jgi:hypothetical protein